MMADNNAGSEAGPSKQQVEPVDKRRSGTKRTLSEIASEFIHRESSKAICRIDGNSGCTYVQSTYDIGNFIRHFRSRHSDLATDYGMQKGDDSVAKKPRTVTKRMVAVDKQLMVEACIKLITFHQLPLACFEWEGLKQLLDPLSTAVGITINRPTMKWYLEIVAQKIRAALAEEMKGKLISVKIDSASKGNRHILGINVQYNVRGRVVIRTIGMVEIRERQTANFLKHKILEILQSYGVSLKQIFSITCDNGANMLAAVRKLKCELEYKIVYNLEDGDEDQCEETNPSENTSENDLTSALSNEFQENLNLVRCAVHTLQLAILDVVTKADNNVKQVTEIAKRCKNVKYSTNFDFHKASYPPVWCQTRWGGIFKMMSCFLDQRQFFVQLAQQFPELDLSRSWEFIEQYVEAFRPLYICTKKMQSAHVSLPDFYMEWIMAIREVRKVESNPFVQPLINSLTGRLTNLRTSMAFKMALFLDPRFNYRNSTIFTADEKEQTERFIIDTWNRIQELKPCASLETAVNPSNESMDEEKDDYITQLFGGDLSHENSSNSNDVFLKQVKALDVESRQTYNYNVWQHWLQRKTTHPELAAVAMVVLATPSNQVSVERAFSALALVLTNLRSQLGQDVLANILLVKLNRELFEQILPSFPTWKEPASVVC